MKKYKELQIETPEKFKQLKGLPKENFQYLCCKINIYLNKKKEHNRLKQHGLKKSKLSLEDRILLTYLRHYPTFLNSIV
ncbi:MAG: hypothetical protein KAI79_07975, partial [Bacteroidales bacterium]|nr:hypothetical protein [Bacteroidales bacterium]